MSPQILELIFFAVIVFFIINKLINILGATDDIDQRTKKSRFGEPVDLKDVTTTGYDWNVGPKLVAMSNNREEIDKSLLVDSSDSELIENLEIVAERVPKFTLSTFVKNAAKAWQIIIDAIITVDITILNELVDKRFIDLALEKVNYYKGANTKKIPSLKVSDVTFFGNSILIKLIVEADKIPTEEWTFNRNANHTGPNWFLSNIDEFKS